MKGERRGEGAEVAWVAAVGWEGAAEEGTAAATAAAATVAAVVAVDAVPLEMGRMRAV